MPKLLTNLSSTISFFENCFAIACIPAVQNKFPSLSHLFMDNEIVGTVSWHSLLQDNLHGRIVYTDHIPTSLNCLLACRSCTQ